MIFLDFSQFKFNDHRERNFLRWKRIGVESVLWYVTTGECRAKEIVLGWTSPRRLPDDSLGTSNSKPTRSLKMHWGLHESFRVQTGRLVRRVTQHVSFYKTSALHLPAYFSALHSLNSILYCVLELSDWAVRTKAEHKVQTAQSERPYCHSYAGFFHQFIISFPHSISTFPPLFFSS